MRTTILVRDARRLTTECWDGVRRPWADLNRQPAGSGRRALLWTTAFLLTACGSSDRPAGSQLAPQTPTGLSVGWAPVGLHFVWGGLLVAAIRDGVTLDRVAPISTSPGLRVVRVVVKPRDRNGVDLLGGTGFVGADVGSISAEILQSARPASGLRIPPHESERDYPALEVVFELTAERPGWYGISGYRVWYRVGHSLHHADFLQSWSVCYTTAADASRYAADPQLTSACRAPGLGSQKVPPGSLDPNPLHALQSFGLAKGLQAP